MLDHGPIQARASDNFVNVTGLCRANGNEWRDYNKTDGAKRFREALYANLTIRQVGEDDGLVAYTHGEGVIAAALARDHQTSTNRGGFGKRFLEALSASPTNRGVGDEGQPFVTHPRTNPAGRVTPSPTVALHCAARIDPKLEVGCTTASRSW